jgi:nitrous oxide reductase accessory protein NosL
MRLTLLAAAGLSIAGAGCKRETTAEAPPPPPLGHQNAVNK